MVLHLDLSDSEDRVLSNVLYCPSNLTRLFPFLWTHFYTARSCVPKIPQSSCHLFNSFMNASCFEALCLCSWLFFQKQWPSSSTLTFFTLFRDVCHSSTQALLGHARLFSYDEPATASLVLQSPHDSNLHFCLLSPRTGGHYDDIRPDKYTSSRCSQIISSCESQLISTLKSTCNLFLF